MSIAKRFKDNYEVSKYRTFEKGEIVFKRHEGGYSGKLQPGMAYVSRSRVGAGTTIMQVPEELLESIEGFLDVEGTVVETGDVIVRLNTTDNVNILERREVIAVTADALMLAAKSAGGRPTAVSDSGKVMVIAKGPTA